MRRRFGKVLSILLAATLTFGCLTGCGNTNEEKTSSTVTSEKTETKTQESEVQKETESVVEEKDYKDVEFRVSWWGSDARHNSTIAWLETFEKEHKNLSIDVEYSGFGDYWTKLSTQATGSELPDVVQMSFAYVKEYADNGLLLPLDEYVESGALDLSNASGDMLSTGVIDDKLVAITTGVNVASFAYNPAVLEKAGVTISATPTMDEFIDVCKKVYDATGAMAEAPAVLDYFRTVGETLYSDDLKSLGVSADAVVSLFEFIADGVEYGYLPGPNTAITNTTSAMAEGKMWLAWSASNLVGTLEQQTGLDLEHLAIPSSDANKAPSCYQPTMMWAVSSTCKNPELAVELINYYVNSSVTYDLTGMDRGVPISSEMREYLVPKMSDAEVAMVEFHDMLDEGGCIDSYNLLTPSGAAEVSALLAEYLELVKFGTLTEKDFLAKAEEFIEKGNAILSSVE